MAETVRTVDYFYMMVPDKPGEGARILGALKNAGVNLLAYSGFPSGRGAQLDFVPADPAIFQAVARQNKWKVKGPKRAFVIDGDDRVGACWEILDKLAAAKINVTALDAVATGVGRWGVHRGHVDLRRGQLVEDLPAGADPVVPVDHERALRALHLPLVLPGDGLEDGGISRDEVELSAPPARETRVGEQVHARVLERTQDSGPLARLDGHHHVEVIAGSHCLSHGDLLQ